MPDHTTPRKTNDSYIARRRIELGLTQAQLGAMVGSSRARVGEWELGKVKPGMKKLMLLAKALDCTLEDICQ